MRRPVRGTGLAIALLYSSPRAPRASAITSLRLFTSNHPLLLTTNYPSSRPQLPYLCQPNASRRAPLLQREIARLLTTENRKYVGQQTYLAVKWSSAGLAMIVLLAFAGFSYRSEQVEDSHPTPPDWSYLTRAAFRGAWLKYVDDENMQVPPDWGSIGIYLSQTLRRLEDPTVDGQELKALSPLGLQAYNTVRDIGPACFDVREKSEAWKAGYVDVVMMFARAAEKMQGFVYDKRQDKYFPESVVVGPSNPYPRKLKHGTTAPRETDCETAFPDPAVLYNRIANGVGFSAKQRIGAMHAHANWLAINGDTKAAGEQYIYALAVARSALSDGSELPDDVENVKDLQRDPAIATLNLITAFTQHASYLARTGHTSEALPIYLSCLRAVRRASSSTSPEDTPSAPLAHAVAPIQQPPDILSRIKGLFREDIYPYFLSTGDEPLSSLQPKDLTCTEAELMLYTGEILFSSSSAKQQQGLDWTRDAVERTAAELRGIRSMLEAEAEAKKQARGRWTTGMEVGLGRREKIELRERIKKCRQCLVTGLGNWDVMARRMADDAESGQQIVSKGWTSWIGFGAGREEESKGRAEEVERVEMTTGELVEEGLVTRGELMAG